MAKKGKDIETTEGTSIDYVPIQVDIHPNFKGRKVVSAKRVPEQAIRLDCLIGVPTNDEEAKELYNCSMADIIAAGVINLGYKERATKRLIERENDVTTASFAAKLAKDFREALIAPPKHRSTDSSRAKALELDRMYADYGLDRKIHTMADLEKAIIAKLTKSK